MVLYFYFLILFSLNYIFKILKMCYFIININYQGVFGTLEWEMKMNILFLFLFIMK